MRKEGLEFQRLESSGAFPICEQVEGVSQSLVGIFRQWRSHDPGAVLGRAAEPDAAAAARTQQKGGEEKKRGSASGRKQKFQCTQRGLQARAAFAIPRLAKELQLPHQGQRVPIRVMDRDGHQVVVDILSI